MIRPGKVLAVLAVFFFVFGVLPAAAEVEQEKCPIMGYKPTEKLFVDYQGKRIYFCCASCPETFMKDPDTYLQKMREEGIFLEDSPDAVPGRGLGDGSKGDLKGGR